MNEPRNLSIDGDRLWASLMEMARIGATEKGGSRRLALTDEDREGRDLFVRWCREAGCTVSVDRIGNIFEQPTDDQIDRRREKEPSQQRYEQKTQQVE